VALAQASLSLGLVFGVSSRCGCGCGKKMQKTYVLEINAKDLTKFFVS
jgi:hypothetical protein